MSRECRDRSSSSSLLSLVDIFHRVRRRCICRFAIVAQSIRILLKSRFFSLHRRLMIVDICLSRWSVARRNPPLDSSINRIRGISNRSCLNAIAYSPFAFSFLSYAVFSASIEQYNRRLQVPFLCLNMHKHTNDCICIVHVMRRTFSLFLPSTSRRE